MGAVAQMDGRRAAGIGQHNGFAGSQTRIARLRRKHAGKDAAHVVIGKDGCHLIEQRRSHAVEMRDAAVPHPQKAQHGVHVVDRGVKRIGRLKLARDEALLEGSSSKSSSIKSAGSRETGPPSSRICRSSSAQNTDW